MHTSLLIFFFHHNDEHFRYDLSAVQTGMLQLLYANKLCCCVQNKKGRRESFDDGRGLGVMMSWACKKWRVQQEMREEATWLAGWECGEIWLVIEHLKLLSRSGVKEWIVEMSRADTVFLSELVLSFLSINAKIHQLKPLRMVSSCGLMHPVKCFKI